MIRRLEHKDGNWVEYRERLDVYEWRDNSTSCWQLGYAKDMKTSISNQLQCNGWKEVAAGIDPNDLQPTCDHRKWDAATDSCAICGKDWNTILWAGKPCCGGSSSTGPHFYNQGKWHASDCDSLKPPSAATPTIEQLDYRPAGSKKGLCTCGSGAVGSDRHSDWCDVK